MKFTSDFRARPEVNRITPVGHFHYWHSLESKNEEVPLNTIFLDIRRLIAFWKVPRLRGIFVRFLGFAGFL
jgi:hypothetical protein